MVKLSDREWKEFKVKHLFTIEKCKCSNASKLEPGDIPYVGATNRNNGVMQFVKENPKLITKGNCIAFICDGQGSVGYSVYKKEDFIGSTTVKVGRNPYINRYTAMFLVSALDKNRFLYSYGYKRNENRLLNETILLPSKDDCPDYEFMEKYIKERERDKREEYFDYCNECIRNITDTDTEHLTNIEWKEFFIKDIFSSVQRGKRLIRNNQTDGNKPYISSSALNNGVDNFISNEVGIRSFSNCLSLANSGSVGACFYEPFEFVASDHVTHLKRENLTSYQYLFMATMLGRLSEKYNFNREINDARISREKVFLPVDNDGNPNFAFMEQYARNIMLDKYKSYIDYCKNV